MIIIINQLIHNSNLFGLLKADRIPLWHYMDCTF